jgi:uncharacterized RDD family membrane protein YckC
VTPNRLPALKLSAFETSATGELDYRNVAWLRVMAYLVDLVIIAIVVGLLLAAAAVPVIASFGLLFPVVTAIVAIVPLAYHTLLIGGPSSATIGMRLFNLEVRMIDGGRPGLAVAFILTVMFYVTVGLTSWLVLLVALFNDRRRTLHDYLCGTHVVRLARVRSGSSDSAPG